VQAHFVRREVLLDALARSPALAVHLVTEFSLRMREFNQQYTNEVVQAERLALVGRFARTIVHDFKNPLNIIGISADMAALEGATPEMRRTARDRVRRQVERMSNMITELLEFTRAGSTPVILGRLELGDYLRPLVEELRMEASPRGVTVVLEGEPAAVRVPLDGRRLAQVFHNLVNNACDAMPAGGEIRLRTRLEPGSVILEVEDTGPGLAPEIASRLFEPFATFGKAHGTGLGLSICRRVVEDHQGEITARNRPGGGAVFTLRLPV
jgi:signal transduction histidine kinase